VLEGWIEERQQGRKCTSVFSSRVLTPSPFE
jgi:hypothetical protein